MTRFDVPLPVLYSATKAPVETLTRHLAQELGPRNITVNTIAPGATATDFSGGLLRDNEQVQERFLRTPPYAASASPRT